MSFENDDIEYEPWRTVEYGNLALVRAVKKRPCLYNNTIPEYSQKDVTRAAWEEIAEEFGCSVDDCKRKWKGLRVVYRREIMQGKKKRKPYYLAKYMHFLRPFIQTDSIHTYRTLFKALSKRNYDEVNDSALNTEISEVMNNIGTTSNKIDELELTSAMNALQNSESNAYSTESTYKNTVQPFIVQCVKASENTSTNNCQINPENPRRQFISSLLPEVEEMTEKQFRNFKRKMLQMIDDVILNS